MTIRTILFAAAMLAAPACNKDKTGKASDRSAEHVNDNASDLSKQARDVEETSANRQDDLAKKEADKAADNRKDLKSLVDKAKDVVGNAADRHEDVAKTARENAGDVASEVKDVTKKTADLQTAQGTFEYDRKVRIATLRGVHAVAASQPMLINAMASSLPYESGDLAMINEKLQIFQMRLDDAGNLIQGLESVEANTWAQRHDDVNKAMDRVEDARKDAWKALKDAKRLDRTSMR